jgi:hypothetical protein
MLYILDEDQSLQYLEGGWEAYAIEEYVLTDLALRDIQEPVAVVLSDRSAVALYVSTPGVVI